MPRMNKTPPSLLLFLLCSFIGGSLALHGRVEDHSFHSTVYNDTAHIFFYTPPLSRCLFSFRMPVTVFLSGLYVDVSQPNEYTTTQVIEAFDSSIYNRESRCTLLVIPKFELGPYDGYWYFNNPASSPIDFLELEVVPKVKEYYGVKVTLDTQQWSLLGHSMGGFGAMRAGMVQNGNYFGILAGLNAAILLWNEPLGYTPIVGGVLYEQSLYSQSFSTPGCNYNISQDGYTFYLDRENTPATYGVNSFCYAVLYDYLGVRENTPHTSLMHQEDCSDYSQRPFYQFVINRDGTMNQDVLNNLTPDRSPISYAKKYASLLQWTSGRIFLSLALEDMEVDPASIRTFSSTLDSLGMKNTLFEYDGGHLDLTVPTLAYLKWLDRVCR